MSNTDTPVKVNTFSDGQTILAAPINQNFDDLFTGLANIGTANLLADGVTTTKILDGNVTLAKLAAAVANALCPAGSVLATMRTTAPDGWVLSGTTIGNAVSGASRANADTETLFLLAYAAMADAQAPVSGGRGASAAADFAAGKTLTLPDGKGRTIAGKEASESRITTAVSGFSGATQGAVGGSQSHTLVEGELAAHTHSITHSHTASQGTHAHTTLVPTVSQEQPAGAGLFSFNSNTPSTAVASTSDSAGAITVSGTDTANSGSKGSNTAHRNVQPTLILTYIVKL